MASANQLRFAPMQVFGNFAELVVGYAFGALTFLPVLYLQNLTLRSTCVSAKCSVLLPVTGKSCLQTPD